MRKAWCLSLRKPQSAGGGTPQQLQHGVTEPWWGSQGSWGVEAGGAGQETHKEGFLEKGDV